MNKSFGDYRKKMYASVNLSKSKLLSNTERDKLLITIQALEDFRKESYQLYKQVINSRTTKSDVNDKVEI